MLVSCFNQILSWYTLVFTNLPHSRQTQKYTISFLFIVISIYSSWLVFLLETHFRSSDTKYFISYMEYLALFHVSNFLLESDNFINLSITIGLSFPNHFITGMMLFIIYLCFKAFNIFFEHGFIWRKHNIVRVSICCIAILQHELHWQIIKPFNDSFTISMSISTSDRLVPFEIRKIYS